MIIDTSALVAILRDEPDAARHAAAIAEASERRVSAATYVEIAAVIDGADDAIASRRLDELFQEARIIIEPVTQSQAQLARQTYRDFGKGRGHAAKLNFADCFAYALAAEKSEPLLFKGDDFARTDIAGAL